MNTAGWQRKASGDGSPLSGPDGPDVSNALALAFSELLGIEPMTSPADELYARLSADPVPVIDDLRFVADQLPDARAILAEARKYEIRPGCEYQTCYLRSPTTRPLVYKPAQGRFR